MKYILIFILCLLSFASKAQFPAGTDTLRNFNNRFITNEATRAFTNLRLHNLLAGMIDHMDTIAFGGSINLGMDTAFMTNDSLFTYRKSGVFRSFIIRGTSDAGGAGEIYRVPYSDGVGHFANDSNFKFDKSVAADAARLIVGPTSISTGGYAKINATSDNMNALALTSYGTGLNTIVNRRARGTIGTPTPLLSGDDLFNISGRGYSGSGFTSASRAAMYAQTTQDWTDTTNGTRLYFATTSNDTTLLETRMIIDDSLQIRPVISSTFDSIAAFRSGPGSGLNTILKVPFSGNNFIQNQFTTGQSASFYIDSIGKVRYLEVDSFATFAPISAPEYSEGRLFYDNDNKTFTMMDDVSGTSIQMAQESILRARNNTGSTILNGKAVYLNGSIGQNPTVALAKADATSTSFVIGLATHDITNNTTGKITTFGLVNDINTSAFSDGDKLYLSESTAGGLTNVPPSPPNVLLVVGYCVLSHVSNGKILVDPQKTASLDSLAGKNFANTDLTFSGNRNHNAATYNLTIDSLTDVDLYGRHNSFFNLPRYAHLSLKSGISGESSGTTALEHIYRNSINTADSVIQRFSTDVNGTRISNKHLISSTKDVNIFLSGTGSMFLNADSVFIGKSRVSTTADSIWIPGPWDVSTQSNPMVKAPKSAITVTPAGSNTQVQFNNSGSFGATSNFIWNDTEKFIRITDNTSTALLQGDGLLELSSVDDTFTPYVSILNDIGDQFLFSLGGSSSAEPFAKIVTTNTDLRIESENDISISGDSLHLKSLPVSTSDSIYAVGPYNSNLQTNTLYKIPASSVGNSSNFIQTANASVSNTTTETTLINTGVGSLVVAPGTWVAGATYEVIVEGDVSTDGTTPATTNYKLKFGSVDLAETGGIFNGTGVSSRDFSLKATIVCRTTGASGTVMAVGKYMDENDGIGSLGSGTTATVDMTTNQTFNITVTMNTTGAGNTVNTYNVIFRRIN